MKLKRVAIIPARGGSKRIPRKNVRLFGGLPLIAYSIQAAQKSEVCDRIIVSTDDLEIAEVARSFGAEVPFIRPKHLADDFTGTGVVVTSAIESLEREGEQIDFACCIYATAPLIRPETIRRGFCELRDSPQMAHAFSVARFSSPVMRSLVKDKTGLRMLFPEHERTRSQDLPDVYHDAGQFYWSRREAFRDNVPMFDRFSIPIELSAWEVQDIDTEEDWRRAELMHRVIRVDD